jgi:TPR repeat protein
MRNLGVCFAEGTGVEADEVKAAEQYQQAAEAGDSYAVYTMGYCYGHGEGVGEGLAKAAEWCSRAASGCSSGFPRLLFAMMTERALLRTSRAVAA